jgi:putative DNA primase/helicase
MRAKSNIGPDTGGFDYDVVQGELQGYPGVIASAIHWGDAIDGNARDLLGRAEPAPDDDRAERQGAAEWLHTFLYSGPRAIGDVQAAASASGWAWRTVQRATGRAGVISRREGFGGTAIGSISATSAPPAPHSKVGGNGATDVDGADG